MIEIMRDILKNEDATECVRRRQARETDFDGVRTIHARAPAADRILSLRRELMRNAPPRRLHPPTH